MTVENRVKSKGWFPDRRWCATSDALLDQEFFDFDAQAERLTGHDQDYLQISDGRFHGRFVSCFLGGISLHLERANQMLAQSICAATDSYSIGVALSGAAAFRADGSDIDAHSLFIAPPGASFHLLSPKNGAILACVVEKQRFETRLAATPALRDLICRPERQISCLHAPKTANRLREDAYSAILGASGTSADRGLPDILGNLLFDSFVASLTLELAASARPVRNMQSKSFERFAYIKAGLDAQVDSQQDGPTSVETIARALGISKRSVQYSFSDEISLGVSSYLRLARLGAVRRSLLDAQRQTSCIGDIAAEHGFWNWSSFSQQYRTHFGENPSQTRRRVSR